MICHVTLAECDIIKHTNDMDAFVPLDYIVSEEHYLLLLVICLICPVLGLTPAGIAQRAWFIRIINSPWQPNSAWIHRFVSSSLD
jgi:hypothetical protein